MTLPWTLHAKAGMAKESSLVDKGIYQRLVGKLLYLSHTILKIGFSINIVSQFMNNLIEAHLKVVYQILRHLKMTLGKGF